VKLEEFFKRREQIGPQVNNFLNQIYPNGHPHHSKFQEVFTRMLGRKDGDFSDFDVSTLATLQKEIHDLNIVITELIAETNSEPNLEKIYNLLNDCNSNLRELCNLRQELDEVNQGLDEVTENQELLLHRADQNLHRAEQNLQIQMMMANIQGGIAMTQRKMDEHQNERMKILLQNETEKLALEKKRLDFEQACRAEEKAEKAKEKAEQEKRRAEEKAEKATEKAEQEKRRAEEKAEKAKEKAEQEKRQAEEKAEKKKRFAEIFAGSKELQKQSQENSKNLAESIKNGGSCTSHTVSRNSGGNSAAFAIGLGGLAGGLMTAAMYR